MKLVVHIRAIAISEFETQLGPYAGAKGMELPLCHVTSFQFSLEILAAGTFDTQKPCPVYADHIIYMFVARPVYRFREEPDAQFGVAFAPVCFLMKASCAGQAIRSLPFDSGGFARYQKEMHPTWELADFEIADPIRIGQIREEFWSDPKAYYNAFPNPMLSFPATKTLLQQYYTLITNGISHGFDTRCSTIEVQLPSPFPLAGNLLAVFAPHSGVDDPAYQALVSSHGSHLIPYRFHEPFYTNDFATSIYDAVFDYLDRESMI
jgi:hypothetical protein